MVPVQLSPNAALPTVVVAVHRQKLLEAREFVRLGGWAKVAQVCRGGMTRQDSVREALWRIGPCDWVGVHDGARPCAEAGLLTDGIDAALDMARHEVAAGARLVEWRVDALAEEAGALAAIQRLVRQSPAPCIVTIRHAARRAEH